MRDGGAAGIGFRRHGGADVRFAFFQGNMAIGRGLDGIHTKQRIMVSGEDGVGGGDAAFRAETHVAPIAVHEIVVAFLEQFAAVLGADFEGARDEGAAGIDIAGVAGLKARAFGPTGGSVGGELERFAAGGEDRRGFDGKRGALRHGDRLAADLRRAGRDGDGRAFRGDLDGGEGRGGEEGDKEKGEGFHGVAVGERKRWRMSGIFNLARGKCGEVIVLPPFE